MPSSRSFDAMRNARRFRLRPVNVLTTTLLLLLLSAGRSSASVVSSSPSSPSSLPKLPLTPPPPPPPAPPSFTANERREHDAAWNAIRETCRGCWSGSISVYGVENKRRGGNANALKPLKGSRERNFRLRVAVDDDDDTKKDQHNTHTDTGTWTVWNLNHEGDEFIIPLARTPVVRPTQIKLGFKGCILRLPAVWTEVPRIVLEVGFWDRRGDGMRRTAVVEYTKYQKRSAARRKWWWFPFRRNNNVVAKLHEISVVQMQAESEVGFIGNTTDRAAVAVLPLEAPFRLSDLRLDEDVTAVKSETVDLRTMVRRVTNLNKLDDDDNAAQSGAHAVHERAYSALRYLEGKDASSFTAVLPCGLCVAMPHKLGLNKRGQGQGQGPPMRCVFAHQWHSGPLQVMEVLYDGDTAEATEVTMYTFERQHEKTKTL